ncbi:MAG: redoxin domain-containing protein [Prevotellaceae bacterium]|jgi:peroxiredoxin|nr:redoxin domain-containing protein [Prevotellaceae bacterium]
MEKLPDAELFTSNNVSYRIQTSDKAIVIVYFKSDCQYCLNEAFKISENNIIFTKAQVYFITVESIEYLKEFESTFSSSKILFLHDKQKYLYDYLQVVNFPSTYIFNSDKKFTKRIVGFAATDEIISYIPNEPSH